MNANLDKIAQELYGKIQTRFNDIKIGDENAGVLSKKEDIPNARFFEFEYTEDGEPLGTIAITLDENDGVVVQVSGDLVNDNDTTTRHGAYKFIRSFRQFAKDRLLNFDIQNIGKSNLDKRDYEFQAKRKEIPMEPMMESKMYGTARMSYQDLGEARLVVKHTQPVNTELAAGRTMHIEGIYIENADGERFKYPFKHLNGARALAEHIKHGGNPYDAIGQHICSLSEELAHLRKFKGYVGRQEQLSEAMASVTGRVIERIEEIKKTMQHLQRPAFYETFAESFEAQDAYILPEEMQNDLIDRLTIRTFNEELKSVFPYIAKFIDESELPVLDVNPDDLLGEVFADDKETGTTHKGGKVEKTKHGIRHHASPDNYGGYEDEPEDDNEPKKSEINKTDRALGVKFKREKKWGGGVNVHADESYDPESQFESFMDNIIREDKDEIFSPNKDAQRRAIGKLNQILSVELAGGPEGINAIESLRGLIDDPEFLNSLRDIDPDLDVRPLVQQFVLSNDPEVATQLHFGGEGNSEEVPPAPEMAAEPMPAEVPPAPEMAAEPMPAEVPPAPEMAAIPPAEPLPGAAPAPVAEAKDTVEKDKQGNVKSWKHEGDWKKADNKNPRGKVTNASGQALKKTIAMAKKAGATLETVLDFGYKEMTLGEAIEACGASPAEFGFEEMGLPAMLKYISGFYSKDEGNFPLGGQRVKIKVKKAFEDGEFGQCDQSDLIKVLKFIDMKDPSEDTDGQHLHAIQRLAGVQQTAPAVGNRPRFDDDVATLETHMATFSESGTDWMAAMKNKLNFGK